MKEGAQVSLVVAQEVVEVPDLNGKRMSFVRKKLKKIGLKVGQLRWRYNENRRANIVLTQTPKAGATAAPGSAVDLVLNEE
jgi:beta-lactam-binding protein with PASTA domain